MVTCDEPTEHYSSGRALLLAYDTIIKDKNISDDEFDKVVYDAIEGKLTMSEIAFLVDCRMIHNGDINTMCPPSMPTSFWIFLLVVAIIIMYILGGKK